MHQLVIMLWSACTQDQAMLATLMYDSGIRRICKALDVLVTSLEKGVTTSTNQQQSDLGRELEVVNSIRTLVLIFHEFMGLNVLGLQHALKGGFLLLFARIVAAWSNVQDLSMPEDDIVNCIDLMLDYVKINLVNFTILCVVQGDLQTWDAAFLAHAFTQIPRLRETWKILYNCFEHRLQMFPSDPNLLRKVRRQTCCNPKCKASLQRVLFVHLFNIITFHQLFVELSVNHPNSLMNAWLYLIKDFKECSRCCRVQYCSVACQENHWPTHKEPCKAFAQMAKGITS